MPPLRFDYKTVHSTRALPGPLALSFGSFWGKYCEQPYGKTKMARNESFLPIVMWVSLEMNSAATVKPWMEHSSNHLLNFNLSETLNRITHLNHYWISGPQIMWEIISICFKLLNCKVVCYTAIQTNMVGKKI